jgi:hypothetical protein
LHPLEPTAGGRGLGPGAARATPVGSSGRPCRLSPPVRGLSEARWLPGGRVGSNLLGGWTDHPPSAAVSWLARWPDSGAQPAPGPGALPSRLSALRQSRPLSNSPCPASGLRSPLRSAVAVVLPLCPRSGLSPVSPHVDVLGETGREAGGTPGDGDEGRRRRRAEARPETGAPQLV